MSGTRGIPGPNLNLVKELVQQRIVCYNYTIRPLRLQCEDTLISNENLISYLGFRGDYYCSNLNTLLYYTTSASCQGDEQIRRVNYHQYITVLYYGRICHNRENIIFGSLSSSPGQLTGKIMTEFSKNSLVRYNIMHLE